MKINKKINFQVSLQHRRIAFHAAILSALVPLFAQANPTGPNIVNGQVSIHNSGGVMAITNSPNAIINWQGFSIKQNEITRFIQQNGQSAVLNRVIGQNPSQIMGQLLSNGKVFLINPNGIIFGANSVVDTQGLIASTLNLSNEDFLNGNYYFKAGTGGAGDILNEGIIRTGKEGNIILIAPNIENSGIISTEGGQITLAAGEEMTITNLDTPDIQFQIQAPDNEVLNLGKVLTEGGAINLFAGTITHSGELNANSVQIDQQGNIQLIAQQDITLTAESLTTANNTQGDAGSVKIESQQDTSAISGSVQATAENTGEGGLIQVLGEWVGLYDQASLDTSGENGGGEILIGGDYQGNNPDIKNATTTYVGQNVQIKADAVTEGDGGKIIAWADDTTEFYGRISATGGSLWGNGGFAEVSGKENLLMTGFANLTATNGDYGTLLLDPGAVTIQDGVGTNTGPNSFDDAYINTQLSLGNLTISTSAASAGNETITFNTDVDNQIFISWAEKTTLSLNAGQNILVNQFSTISNSHIDTNFDAIVMNANQSATPVSGTFRGIDINAANLSTVGGGIKLSGRGGDNLGAQYGIYLHNAASISTTNGSVILNGTAGPGTFASNHGVFITDPNTNISVNAGSLEINGIGGSDGTNSNNNGITFSGEVQLSSTTGNITLNGTGPNGTSSNYGVYLAGNPSSITSADGTISITGTGGAGTGGSNYGVFLTNGVIVETTGIGDIFFNGTGGGSASSSGNNHGIFINTSTIKTWNGNINLTGLGGAVNGINSYGFFVVDSLIGDPTVTTGDMKFKFGGMTPTSHLSIDVDTLIRTNGNVFYSPYNASDTLGFGSVNTTDYQFNNAVINTLLTATTAASAIFGRSDGTGDISLQTATFPDSVKFLSSTGNINILNDLMASGTSAFSFDTGGDVVFSANSSTITAPGGVFLNKGTLILGTSPTVPSILNVAGNGSFNFGAGTTYAPRIGTGGISDLLNADFINIDPTSTLSVQSVNGYTGSGLSPASFSVIKAEPTNGLIIGTFAAPITVNATILNNITTNYSLGKELVLNMLAGGTTFQLKVVEADGTYLWSNPANWGGAIPVNNTSLTIPDLAGTPIIVYNSGTVVPQTLTAAEELRITAGSLIFDDNSSFNSKLDIRGGTFGANGGVLNVLGDFSWTGGTLTGAGTLDLSAATSVAINGASGAVLDGTTLNLANALNITTGSFTLQNDATLNAADFTLQNGASFNLLNGSLTSTNNIAVDGNFTWGGGSVNTTNNVNIGSTGIMTITGNNTLTANSINNQGTLVKSGGGGTSNLNGVFTNTGVVTAASGQMNFNSYNQNNGMTQLNGGALQTGTFNIVNGQLAGNGSLNGNVSMGAGSFLNPGFSPGLINITGNLNLDPLSTLQIELGGTTPGTLYDQIIVTGAANLAGNLTTTLINGFIPVFSDTFNIINATGGVTGTFDGTLILPPNFATPTYNATDVSLTQGIPTLFTWLGPSSGTAFWSVAANWGGLVPTNGSDVVIPNQAGNLTVIYDASAGTVALKTLQNSENLTVSGGSLSLGNTLTNISNFASGTLLNLSEGNFGGPGTVNVLGNFNWTGGTLAGGGVFDLSAATSININGTTGTILDGTRLNLSNALNLTAGSFTMQNGAILNVADFSLQNGASFNQLSGDFTSSNNIAVDGTFNWGGGNVSATNNVNIGSTGIMTITGNNTLTASSINNQGTLKKAGGAGVSNLNAAFSNTGVVTAASGQLNFNSYSQTAGMTMLNGGILQTGTFNIVNGQLAGNGSLNGNVSMGANAILNPGFSSGILTINGDLSMTSTTLSKIEIGGLTQGSLYDWIKVSGNAFLNGTLQVLEINGFSAVDGNTFTPITCGGVCNGAFASTTFPNLNWTHNVNTNNVTLLNIVVPVPVIPTPVAPTPVTPTPVTPTPVAPTPVTPLPVTPTNNVPIETFIDFQQKEVLIAMINEEEFIDSFDGNDGEGGTDSGTGETETGQETGKGKSSGGIIPPITKTTYTLEQCK